MSGLSKKRKATTGLYDRNKTYLLEEALDILKKTPKAKFDETVELSINLSLNTKDTSQVIRGTAILPHGTGKNIRTLVFCKQEDEQKAKDAGADFAGSDELINKVAGGWCDFDVAIATTNIMREIAKLGRVLGPRGLMPNPKTGTVTDDIAKTIKDVKAGKMEFKMDKQGGIHAGVGKISFPKDALSENIKQLINAIFSSNPSLNKPQIVKSMVLATTMGPGLKLDPTEFRK
ncbi:MAG: 50S ribosomal protein L1 [Omnitrophica bacterium RBG_13_46_9]|nr:MAG: 50S ribosomal protein L1 [Omnitrophica bacterium RBG_13_46_9]